MNGPKMNEAFLDVLDHICSKFLASKVALAKKTLDVSNDVSNTSKYDGPYTNLQDLFKILSKSI